MKNTIDKLHWLISKKAAAVYDVSAWTKCPIIEYVWIKKIVIYSIIKCSRYFLTAFNGIYVLLSSRLHTWVYFIVFSPMHMRNIRIYLLAYIRLDDSHLLFRQLSCRCPGLYRYKLFGNTSIKLIQFCIALRRWSYNSKIFINK